MPARRAGRQRPRWPTISAGLSPAGRAARPADAAPERDQARATMRSGPTATSDWTVAQARRGRRSATLLGEAALDRGRGRLSRRRDDPERPAGAGLRQRGSCRVGPAADRDRQPQSVCASSMMALKNAALNVRAGEHRAALARRRRIFEPLLPAGPLSRHRDVRRRRHCLPADAEFLRWTLSDGAAALLIEDRPAARGLSLKIDWMCLRSFADRFEPCMTGGGVARGRRRHHAVEPVRERRGRRRGRRLPAAPGRRRALPDAAGVDGRVHAPSSTKGGSTRSAIDWFLCHFSAHSLREEMVGWPPGRRMIPEERWFTNLYDKGNVGAASLYLLIDDLLRSGRLEAGPASPVRGARKRPMYHGLRGADRGRGESA